MLSVAIITMIATYNITVTDAADEILKKERRRKIPRSREMFSKRSLKKGGVKQKELRNTGTQTEGLEGSVKSKGGLDRCSVPGDWSMREQKQQQERILAGEDGWMGDLRFYVLSLSISAIPGQWGGDNERLCSGTPFAIEMVSVSGEVRPGNARSVGQHLTY